MTSPAAPHIDQPTHLEPIEYEQLRIIDTDLAEQLGHLADRISTAVAAADGRPSPPEAHIAYFADLRRRLGFAVSDIATFVEDLDLADVTDITPGRRIGPFRAGSQPVEIDVIARRLPTFADEIAALDQAMAETTHIGFSWDQSVRIRRYVDLYIQIGHIVDELLRIADDTGLSDADT